jgi:hypothetical protein
MPWPNHVAREVSAQLLGALAAGHPADSNMAHPADEAVW